MSASLTPESSATSGAHPREDVCSKLDTYRLAVGWFPVHVCAGRPQIIPVSTLVVGDKRHHLPVDFLVRQEDSFHPSDLGQKPKKDGKCLPGPL